tara:strand:- start:462 stop:590 length:129 start_codon:yes stop_codon:yes gene_type:complete
MKLPNLKQMMISLRLQRWPILTKEEQDEKERKKKLKKLYPDK